MMYSKPKRFFIILAICVLITFPLFFAIEEDRNCIFEWGTRCSNAYFIKTSVQVVFMTAFFFYIGGKKTAQKK